MARTCVAEARLEEHLAHQQEQRDRHQREGRQRPPAVVQKADDPAFAAHEDPGAEDVRRKERQRHGHAERHEKHDAAHEEREGFEPFHYS
jgi:hypothetical protein